VSEPPQARWPAWFGPLALLIGLVGGLVLGSVVAAVIPGGITHGNLSPAATDLATLIQDLGFVAAAVFLAKQVSPVDPSMFGLVRTRAWRALGVVVGALVLWYLVSALWFLVLNSSGQEKEFVKEIGGNGSLGEVLAACAVACVVAPICEEFLFRGFIFRALSNWRGPWPAAIATGLLFGAVHGLSAPAVDLFPLAVLGIVLCGVYQLTGSLYPCVVLHVINNAIALGGDENWDFRTVELAAASLAAAALVFVGVHLASARWTPATG
jgi:membrane protease YdiL (CAAX protease family)